MKNEFVLTGILIVHRSQLKPGSWNLSCGVWLSFASSKEIYSMMSKFENEATDHCVLNAKSKIRLK